MRFTFKKYQVSANNKDITEGVVSTEIFQDIQNPSWSCIIHILDSVDLFKTVPFGKGTPINITFSQTTSDEVSLDFVVYKVGNKILQNQKTYMYSLYCVTPAFITNMSTRLSRLLKGESTSVIKSIVEEKFKDYKCDIGSGSNSSTNVIANNWQLFNTIGTLLKTTHTNGVADFLFFQNTNKSFVVRSIREMMNLQTNIVFKMIPAGLGEKSNYKYNFTKYKVEHFDSAVNLNSGYYGNTVYTYDLLNKRFDTVENKNDVDNEKLSDGNSDLFNDIESSNVTFMPKIDNSISDNVQDWTSSRKQSLLRLEQEKLIIQTQGNNEYIDMIGKSCIVDFPNQSLNSGVLDDDRSGSYIVTAMSHVISRAYFVSNIELVKREFEVSS